MSEQFLYFLQQMFNGVTLGSTYALIAIGYTMVYGIIGMINFAHGEVYMIGSYVSFMIIAALMMMGIDSSWLLVAAGFVGAIVIASAYGWSIERVAYRPVRSSKRLIALISAIGMSIFLQNYVSLTEGSRDIALPSLFNGQWIIGSSENFAATVTTMQLVIWVVTFVAMLALTLFIRYSRMGRACRACAEDLKMASLLGINTDRVIALTFVIGAAMAAVAGRVSLVIPLLVRPPYPAGKYERSLPDSADNACPASPQRAARFPAYRTAQTASGQSLRCRTPAHRSPSPPDALR